MFRSDKLCFLASPFHKRYISEKVCVWNMTSNAEATRKGEPQQGGKEIVRRGVNIRERKKVNESSFTSFSYPITAYYKGHFSTAPGFMKPITNTDRLLGTLPFNNFYCNILLWVDSAETKTTDTNHTNKAILFLYLTMVLLFKVYANHE